MQAAQGVSIGKLHESNIRLKRYLRSDDRKLREPVNIATGDSRSCSIPPRWLLRSLAIGGGAPACCHSAACQTACDACTAHRRVGARLRQPWLCAPSLLRAVDELLRFISLPGQPASKQRLLRELGPSSQAFADLFRVVEGMMRVGGWVGGWVVGRSGWVGVGALLWEKEQTQRGPHERMDSRPRGQHQS